MNWKIPLSDLRLTQADRDAVMAALESNWLTMGERTANFEKLFADALDPVNPPHCLAVGNCTLALHMAMVAAGVGPGDEVILPSLTFVATANAVLYTGATVVLADVTSPEDWTICPEDVRAKITPRTKAILPVHYAGRPCDMVALRQIAKEHKLVIVEDNAHGPLADGWIDAAHTSQALGTIGEIGCFSFFSNKNMTTGEGGMIVTRDDAMAQKLRLLRAHGMTTLTMDRHKGHAFSYDVVELGFNYRIDEPRAALGISQLSRLPENNAKRAQVTAWYNVALTAIPGLTVPFAHRPAQGRQALHIMPVLLPEGVAREGVQIALRDAGVQTSIHYRPIHTFTYHSTSPQVVKDGLALTDLLTPRILTLPLYPSMTQDDVHTVADALKTALAGL
jgi:dTDP-4-amino-4,6-dideoxygalactose transaminase